MLDVIIETPKGSRHKFAYDPKSRLFKLSKILAQGMVFPYDFGFVPDTKGEDGDPLDVLVLVEEPTFPGCLLECALIGVIEAQQREVTGETNQNDRLVGVAVESQLYSDVTHLDDLSPRVWQQIEAFFVNYQKLRNVEFTIRGRGGPERAVELLRAGGLAVGGV